MTFEVPACVCCGGQVTAERISAHPSGITIEYGACLACGSQLRRVLAAGVDAPVELDGAWSTVPVAAPARRHRRRHRVDRPPRGVGSRHPGR